MQSTTSQNSGPGTTLNPFAGILTAAQQAGFRVPKVTAAPPPVLASATGLVEAANAYHSTLCKVQSLRAHKDAPLAADILTQQALCKLLRVANSNNKAIVKGQQEIADRVRALKAKECIPVERLQQPEFVALLRAIFESGPTLQQLYEDVMWAVNASEPGAIWEDRLQPLLGAVANCEAYEACLAQRDQLMARLHAQVAAPHSSAPA